MRFLILNEEIRARRHIEDSPSEVDWLSILGLDFEAASVPSLEEFSERFEAYQKQSLVEWNRKHPENQINDEDRLVPGFALENPKTKAWLYLKYGDSIPDGYAIPAVHVVPGSVLYRSLAAGIFPLNLGGALEVFIHDVLGHLTGYLVHPDYMKAYRNLAKKIVARPGGPFIKNKSPDLFHRVFYYNEALTLVSEEKLLKELSHFSVPLLQSPSFGLRGYTRQQIFSKLAWLTDRDFIKRAEKILQLVPHLQMKMGGASRGGSHSYESPAPWDIVLLLVVELRWQLNDFVISERRPHSTRRSLRRAAQTSLARLQALLLALSMASPQSWSEEIYKEESADRNGTLCGFIFGAESGIFTDLTEDQGPRFADLKKTVNCHAPLGRAPRLPESPQANRP